MSEPERGVPPPVTRQRLPPAPQINPEVVEFLKRQLTIADCQYIVGTIKNRIIQAYEKMQAENPNPAEAIPASPEAQAIIKDIDEATAYITRGYTVQYTSPNQKSSGEGESLLNMAWDWFNDLKPDIKDKIGDAVGELLDMLVTTVKKAKGKE